MPPVLRPYQEKAVADIYAAFDRCSRVCCVAPCGAGKSVVIQRVVSDAIARGHRPLVVAHRAELVEQLRKRCPAAHVVSVQSAARNLGKFAACDIVVVDEAHHCSAATYRKVCEGRDFVIGFTATPMRMGGKPLGTAFDVLVPTVSVPWLIENGFLSPFIHHTFKGAVDTSKLKVAKGTGEYTAESQDEGIDAGAVAEVIRGVMEEGRKTVVYAHSVKQSMEYARAVPGLLHLDGKTHPSVRADVFRRFRAGEVRAITNMDLFGEGIDVPDCDAVVLARPTRSYPLYVQQAMRCMRADPGNPGKVAHVYDVVGNHAELMPDGATVFGTVDEQPEWSLDRRAGKDPQKKPVLCPECGAILPKPHGTETITDEEGREVRLSLRLCPNCGRVHETAYVVPHLRQNEALGLPDPFADLEGMIARKPRLARYDKYAAPALFAFFEARKRRGLTPLLPEEVRVLDMELRKNGYTKKDGSPVWHGYSSFIQKNVYEAGLKLPL